MSGPTAGVSGRPQFRLSWLQRRCRQAVMSGLVDLTAGHLVIKDPLGAAPLGPPSADLRAEITVRDGRLYPMIVRGGSLAAAEAYLRGYWDADSLVDALRVFARHADAVTRLERSGGRFREPLRVVWNTLRRNTLAGSRRNIAAHYDLSNAFFERMLDPTMTYSCGIFQSATDSLEQASRNKYDRICRKLQLGASDRLLEIGCGWGGFALHAATRYGCHVTATTISRQQFEWARQRIRAAGMQDRIELLQRDYRDLQGPFDKLVSIEMIEAVGESFLDRFFGRCCRLLEPDGMMVLQAITMPDYRYDAYRRSVDFIRRYVFPGGFLPSFSAIGQSLRRATDFQLVHLDDLSRHYVGTLACWRDNFLSQREAVQRMGFDDRFMRLWEYYLCYCQAGFAERQTGVNQLTLVRPRCRRAD